jgi:hypothetical protein
VRTLAKIGISLVTVGIVVAGLGVSAASGDALSKKAYLSAANGVCKTTNKALEAVFTKAFEGTGDNGPTDAEVEDAAREAVPVLRDGLDKIDDLEGPTAVDKKVGKVLDAYRKVLDKIEDDPNGAFKNEDPFAKADKAARKAGIKECTQA